MQGMSQQAALELLLEMMDYTLLRKEQSDLRVQGIYRGIGIATVVEGTADVRDVRNLRATAVHEVERF